MKAADLPSRGCSFKQLCESRWWEGPDWLYEEEEKWPQTTLQAPEAEVNAERNMSYQLQF